MIEANTVQVGAWTIRLRMPEGSGPFPVVLMLHGWTGDETAMWVFAPRLPRRAILVAPRGMHTTLVGGYGWHDHKVGSWPTMMDFRPAVEALLDLMIPQNFPTADFRQWHLVGFSQGAALCISLGLLRPEKVASLASLSGFLPEQIHEFILTQPLSGKPVFIAHGTRDEIVPVDKAHLAVSVLREAGAEVVYCEDDVGHKLSANCFSSLEHFYAYTLRKN